MIYYLLALFGYINLVSYITFTFIEGIHELRRCKREYPSGGYYQKFTLGECLAIRYLHDRCEISIDPLPQGGTNVHPYDWDRFEKNK